MSELFDGVFAGKRTLVTGHTGFKGSWLSLWLHELRAIVTGYALDPPTVPCLFEAANVQAGLARHIVADVRDASRLGEAVMEGDPEVIFHLAAQPLVRESYRDPVTTVATNVMGVVNLLEAVRARVKPCVVIVVTSDKCYENREWVHGYRENDRLGGYDPYSMSKAAAELVVASWRRSYFPPGEIARHGIAVATVRAGNVIGGGDWQQERIVVDCVKSLASDAPIPVRNPSATRPWQHVLEPLGGYLLVASKMLSTHPAGVAELASAWNFGPRPEDCWRVSRLVDEVIRCWGSGTWEDVSAASTAHEAGFLALSCEKAARVLGWRPVWPIERAVAETAGWYKAFARGGDAGAMCRQQIASYSADAHQVPVGWGGNDRTG